jgi:phytoene synthase
MPPAKRLRGEKRRTSTMHFVHYPNPSARLSVRYTLSCLADDEQIPHEERLIQSQRWLEEWHCAAAGEPTTNPVFIALRDTQQRFAISTELLDQLVQGTMLDLTVPAGTAVTTYPTFEDLYRYCYFVASVVGLVCIRIFGYTDPRAEALAEQTGVAFQLTNILRDVREDAERGRVYLPLDDLRKYDLTPEQFLSRSGNQPTTAEERGLLELEAGRARQYYKAADDLLPLIAPDSRAAMWVLVAIYRRLLQRIEAAHYEVFAARVSVPTGEKLWILCRGLWMAFPLRLAQKI